MGCSAFLLHPRMTWPLSFHYPQETTAPATTSSSHDPPGPPDWPRRFCYVSLPLPLALAGQMIWGEL